MYTITTVYKLDIGHRTWSKDIRHCRGKEFYQDSLAPSKCANIHGHSILVSTTLESETLDEQNCVMDTDLIKAAFRRVVNELDHAFIMDKNDPLFEDMKGLIAKENLRLYVVDFSPSFEALAKHLFEKMKALMSEHGYDKVLKMKEIKISGENMTIAATYREERCNS